MSSSRFFLLFSLFIFLALITQPQLTEQTGSLFHDGTTKALITTACSASSSPPLCYNVLNVVANNPYLDPCDLTIVAVQAASKTSIATFDFINMTLTIKAQIIADPDLRKSLVICAKEYKNILDLLDKTTTALTQKVDQPNIPEYLTSAVAAVAKCDASCVKFTNKVVHISTKNIDCTKLIKNALNIYQVFAEYTVNPNHDPKKSTIKSAPNTKTPTTPNMKFSIPFFGGGSAQGPTSDHDDGADSPSASPSPSPSLIPSSHGMRFPFQSYGTAEGPTPDESDGDSDGLGDSASPGPSPSSGGFKFPFPNFGGAKFPYQLN